VACLLLWWNPARLTERPHLYQFWPMGQGSAILDALVGSGGPVGGGVAVTSAVSDQLLRRSGQAVQDRPLRSVGWADIPGLSIRGRRCPPSWQQYWQQSHRTALDSLPARQSWTDELRVAGRSNPQNNINVGTAAGTPCTPG
jgi:hypothetical protein